MIYSDLLSQIPGIRHGFGTRNDTELPKNLVTAKQVHEASILHVTATPSSEPQGFDILVTDQKGIAIAVKTADCLPILMVEPKAELVAAVHAGWRGTVARVVEKAVATLCSLGGRMENLRVSLGPNMKGSCYEVEQDVVSVIEKEFRGWPVLTRKNETKWLLDVAQINQKQLQGMGLLAEQIEHRNLCTHCQTELFYSYRRERERAGRMINYIQIL